MGIYRIVEYLKTEHKWENYFFVVISIITLLLGCLMLTGALVVKDNIPVTLYLCQYYLIKMRNYLNYHYAYMIYEINYLTMKKIKKKDKTDKKAKGFLKENLLLDKIMKIVSILCTSIERLLHMKNLKNVNSKLLYTCEDILKPLTEYVRKNKMLIGFVISFTKKHIFELSIEVKFL